MAAKEEKVQSLTLELQETSEELQGAIESLEESYKVNAALLQAQLADLEADKVLLSFAVCGTSKKVNGYG